MNRSDDTEDLEVSVVLYTDQLDTRLLAALAVAGAALLLPAQATCAEPAEPGLAASFADSTEEYLSDPSRVGSLSGSILMGALWTHPWAPLVGSVAGFFLGKHSDFSRNKEDLESQIAYGQRSIIPAEGETIGAISLYEGGSTIEQPAQTAAIQPAQPATPYTEQPQSPGAFASNPRSTDTFQQDMQKPQYQPSGTMHQIMAALCYNSADGGPNRLPVDRDPCFYYRQ